MDLKTSVSDFLETSSIISNVGRATAITLSLLLILIGTLGFIWDTEPGLFDIAAVTEEHTTPLGARVVIGSATVATTIEMANTLLAKPGGYLENDLAPPGVWMDNIPNWEFGVLVQIRDMVRIMRKTLSRSQSQSQEDADLITAENQFYFDSNSWILPDTEGEYARGIIALTSYLERLGDDNLQDAQFYARADNLQAWLAEVETRLGSLSQRLSASVGKRQLDVSLAGDSAASQSTATNRDSEVKTPYFELDDTLAMHTRAPGGVKGNSSAAKDRRPAIAAAVAASPWRKAANERRPRKSKQEAPDCGKWSNSGGSKAMPAQHAARVNRFFTIT